MTERENLRRMLSGEGADWLPLDVWVTEPALDLIDEHTGSRNEAEALGLAVTRIGPKFPMDEDRWRAAYGEIGFEIPEHVEFGSSGTLHEVPPRESLGAAYHLRQMCHPLSAIRTTSQLERLPWPDPKEERWYAHVREHVERAREAGRASIGQYDCTFFETAWYLRGMENLFLDLADGSGIGDWILDRLVERAAEATKRLCRAGVDILWLGDDVGTQRGLMMSVAFWREHLKPRLAKITAGIREERGEGVWIAYHSDGDVRPILEDLIEIGIDILNPVQPECMPLKEVVLMHQDRLAFWGMIGTQTTMPFGSSEDVRARVDEIRSFAEDGVRVIVSPTHAIEPDVPWENLEALVDQAKMPLTQRVPA